MTFSGSLGNGSLGNGSLGDGSLGTACLSDGDSVFGTGSGVEGAGSGVEGAGCGAGAAAWLPFVAGGDTVLDGGGNRGSPTTVGGIFIARSASHGKS